MVFFGIKGELVAKPLNEDVDIHHQINSFPQVWTPHDVAQQVDSINCILDFLGSTATTRLTAASTNNVIDRSRDLWLMLYICVSVSHIMVVQTLIPSSNLITKSAAVASL